MIYKTFVLGKRSRDGNAFMSRVSMPVATIRNDTRYQVLVPGNMLHAHNIWNTYGIFVSKYSTK